MTEMKLTTLQPDPKELEILRDDLIGHFSQFELVHKVYSFGSLVRADWDSWSDIDLLLITSRNPTLKELLATLSSYRSLLHRSNFAIQEQPVGGYLLGVLFMGSSVFHNLDLNFMTIKQHTVPQNLEKFGKLELLYQNVEKPIQTMPNVNGQNDDLLLTPHEQEIEYAIHWTKKAIKKVLRGQSSVEELYQTSTKLNQLLSTPNELWSERGDVCKVANAFLEIAGELLKRDNYRTA